MPAAKTAKRGKAAAKTPDERDNGRADYVPPEPSLRDQADAIRKEHGYDGDEGGIGLPMLQALEPLLAYPLDPRYIERTEPTKGKPYASTGVRSVQVQVDRMNEVLGAAHWRVLYRYEQAGQLCKAVVVVGNDLQYARLDDRGDLVPFTLADRADQGPDGTVMSMTFKAEILAIREGWGGHSRGSAPADVFKGSETNALKRVLARLGPGADVYRLDFDDDVNLSNEPEARPVAARQAPAQAEGPSPEQMLDALLKQDSPLKPLRNEVARGMVLLGAPVRQRLDELKAAADERQLDALLERINIAIDAGGQGTLEGASQ